MDFKKTAMGMLAAAVAASPVVVAQSNSAHGSAHGSTSTATHSGPLFTGIICGQSDTGSDEISLFSEFFTSHGHTFWAGGGNSTDASDEQSVGWRMQTNNIHPSTWQVDMNLYSNTDENDNSGVDSSYFTWFLNNGGSFLGEYIDLDTISNTEPTCVTAKSLSNGYVRYTYNARNDPGVCSGTKYGSGVYFNDYGPTDESSWEDLATNPYIAGHGAIPDAHNTPSFDCNFEYADSFVGS